MSNTNGMTEILAKKGSGEGKTMESKSNQGRNKRMEQNVFNELHYSACAATTRSKEPLATSGTLRLMRIAEPCERLRRSLRDQD